MKINQMIYEVDPQLEGKERNALHTRMYNYLKKNKIKHRKRGRAVEVPKIDAQPVIEHFKKQLGQKKQVEKAVIDAEAVKSENLRLKKKVNELREENSKLHKRVSYLNDKIIEYADLMQVRLVESDEIKGKGVGSKGRINSSSSRRKSSKRH